MTNYELLPWFAASRNARATSASLAAVLIWLCLLAQSAPTQTLSVLHTFTGEADGAGPVGLTIDAAGNLYGTTGSGGLAGCEGNGCGIVFKVSRAGSGWTLSPLYTFTGGDDGALPLARVILGRNGTLYGTTALGGAGNTGVVFNLQPPVHVMGRVFNPWTETVLYHFGGVADGNYPGGDLLFDAAGNIYGTTEYGGSECGGTSYCGTVYELIPSGSGWSEDILYEFTNENVAIPLAGVIFDDAGNLYGMTSNAAGAVYELMRSGSGWTESTLFEFGYEGGGYSPARGLIFDPLGHLYGTAQFGGTNGAGTVFELMSLGGSWNASTLFNFTGGGAPRDSLVRDASGNLYGTTCFGGVHNSGTVFKLTPSGGGWTETDLHDFSGDGDGYCPMGNVILDAQGNIYGTACEGGSEGYGTVFEITL
jgi:uncharacterized repeat protein (TIGR03803 family)